MQKIYGVSSLSEVPLSKLSTRVPDASPGDKYGVMVMPDTQSGILILCPAEREARTIEISTDSYDAYQIDFYLHEVKKGSLPLPLARPVKGGTYKRVLKLPTAMAGTKFDRILVKPLVGDGFYSLAYLILDPA